MQGPVYRFEPKNEAQAYYWTTEYPSCALIPMVQLIQRVRDTALPHITTPVLVLYSSQDQIVDAMAIEKQFKRIPASVKKIKEIKIAKGNQPHVIAGDILSPETTQRVFREILSFIDGL